MSNVHCQQVEASPAKAEALLAGILAAAEAALPHGLDPLVWGAARLGDQTTLRHLLANGGKSSWTPMYAVELWGGKCCLWAAARNGHEGAVKELVEFGMNVDRVQGGDPNAWRGEEHVGSTPLCVAAEEGHEGVIEQLLKAGADVNKSSEKSFGGTTPLCAAAQRGHEGVVDRLLEAGADVNKVTSGRKESPLFLAAAEGHEGVVKRLLKAEAVVDTKSAFGHAPLFISAQTGHEGVVEQLLKAGAEVKMATANDGITPLLMAAQNGHAGVVEQLLKARADPNAETHHRRTSNYTPLIVASSNGHSRVCSLLLEAGANVNQSPGRGANPLRDAVLHGHREVALMLVEHGASSSDMVLAPKLLQTLNKWMADALKENKRQMDQMLQAIPEWCAQAASSVAAQGVKNTDPQQPDASVGRKRMAPSAAAD